MSAWPGGGACAALTVSRASCSSHLLRLSPQAMWLMLQKDEPEDFVIATGGVHSVREFVEKSFLHIGKTIV